MISKENKNRLIYGTIFISIMWFGTLYSPLSCSILFAIIGLICLYEMVQLRKGKTKIIALLYVLIPFVLIQIVIWKYLNTNINSKEFEDLNFWVNDWILKLFILTWSFDSFAYLIGIKFGKNKIMTSISPKKSWEGFFGGMLITIILAYLYSLYKEENNLILLSIIVPFLATIGDFIESAYKREAGVKDSSKLIPGHGGMLDRMDSLLISISVLSIFLIILF